MKTKPTRPLTPAQIQARLAAHKPSWNVLLHDKLNKLTFPSLMQGADKLTEGKRLAGILSILRHNDPEITKSPIGSDGRLNGKGCTCIMAEVGRRLEKAVLEQDTKFLRDFRKTSLNYKSTSKMSDVYRFLLMGHHNKNRREKGYRKIEDLSRAELWRLVKKEFPTLQPTDRPTLYRVWKEIFPDVR